MQNQIKSKNLDIQYHKFSISPIYSAKIQTSYSPFSEFEHSKNRHRNQSQRNKTKTTFQNQKNEILRQDMMGQDSNYDTLNKQLSRVSINQCEDLILNNPEEKQKVFNVIEAIRKSLCHDHIILNLNLIMSSGLYQPIISHSHKLAYLQTQYNEQNQKNISTLKQCLWILTNLCTGTQEQIKAMINAGLISLIDLCLKLKSHKLIIISTFQLIGNLVGDEVLEIKLHFLQNQDFFNFYQNRLEQYWYEDDGKFSEKIVWILTNTFYRVPTLITDYQKWKLIVIKYLPIFISLLQISYRTASSPTTNKLIKQYIQKHNKIQSQQYLNSKNTQIESLPNKSSGKTSKKTIKNCYFIFETITCIDYPYLFINLHQFVKCYDFQVVPNNCRNYIVRMYANIIGFYNIEGINFVYQYKDLLKYIIHQIRAQKKTKQNTKDPHNQITPICFQILTTIFQHTVSTQKFIQQYFQQFQRQLTHWFVDFINNNEIISAIMKLLLQLLKICIKMNFVGVVDRIFYYALGFVHENMTHIVIKVDGLEGCGLQHDDYNVFLSVINNYLHLYVLYFQFIKHGTKSNIENSNHRIKYLYTKLSQTMMQHKNMEQILIKIYNIYTYQLKKSKQIQKRESQLDNVSIIQNFISYLLSTSILLTNNLQYMQKMLLDYEMTGLCV